MLVAWSDCLDCFVQVYLETSSLQLKREPQAPGASVIELLIQHTGVVTRNFHPIPVQHTNMLTTEGTQEKTKL